MTTPYSPATPWARHWLLLPRRCRVEGPAGRQRRLWLWGPCYRRPSATNPGRYVYALPWSARSVRVRVPVRAAE